MENTLFHVYLGTLVKIVKSLQKSGNPSVKVKIMFFE